MQEVQIQAYLIRFHGMISSLFSLITGLELREIPVIVPLPAANNRDINMHESLNPQWETKKTSQHSHFVEKDTRFTSSARGDKVLINNSHDITADIGQLRLHLLPILLYPLHTHIVPFRLFLLLNRRKNPPRSPTSTHHVLVPHRQKVPLLNR